MSSLIDVLKYSGPISLPDLRVRVSAEPRVLVMHLTAREAEGFVKFRGPLSDLIDRAFTVGTEEEAALATVELSSRGLKSVMA